MRIPDVYAQPGLTLSFEFFPPKTDEAEEALFRDTVPALKRLGPGFISVTYGAGGSTRERTLRIVNRLLREYDIEALAHLTCVCATREQIGEVLEQARGMSVQNILALRGDPPKGQTTFQPTEGGFKYAIDLVRFVREQGGFAIGAACSPEGHIECPDKYLDWDRTAAKVEAGAEFLLSQLFYDVEDFFTFHDYLTNKHNVRVPIVPGVLPFLSTEQIKRFTTLCGAKLPPDVTRRLETYAGDDEAVRQYGVELCTDLCRRLIDYGVPGLHLYCLNRTQSCTELLRNLGLAKAADCCAA